MTTPVKYDTIVLGAGGAGLMCAAVAGQGGQSVLILDHAEKAGKKILISGGGRCNFTNTETVPSRFISANPHFAKSALGRYQPQDFIDLVDLYGIKWHEKTLGQLFCDEKASQIVSMLLQECAAVGAKVELNTNIDAVTKTEAGFMVEVGGKRFEAAKLVVATGGPSIPKMGATGFAYDLARQFGLKVVEPKPALVPFTLGPDETLFKDLTGVACETIVRFGKSAFREASLFTHKGLSGPAILQISSYWKHGQPVTIDFMPNRTGDWLLARKKASSATRLEALLQTVLPDRLVDVLSERLGVGGALGNFSDKALQEIEAKLHNWSFQPNGTEGFAKAEVTVGGVSTNDLSSKTMEAKRVSGLYFIGEAVDVTGWLGGYNFQWAWASGWAAGQAVAD